MRLLILLFLCSCSSGIHQITTPFADSPIPPSPTYNLEQHWAALPGKRDAADSIPKKSTLKDEQALAKADVFFIYPTIFTEKPENQYQWNADVNDQVLNQSIQQSTILYQATVFNGSCRVYAPYYRQAHLYSFYTPQEENGRKALELAYQDVRLAFQYYLDHYNQGRPIVIASHSQGSYHGMRLLKEFFDGKDLARQLVFAYLIGRAIPADAFDHIKTCSSEDETGAWASWNTFAFDYKPSSYDKYYPKALSVNPLIWNASETFAAKSLNKGGVGLNFTLTPEMADAQNHQNLLWTHKPYVKGRFWVHTKVWHRADINLFYVNIRENVALRIQKFLENPH